MFWIVTIFIGALLDILCYKYRKLAHLIFYMETLLAVSEAGLPLKHAIEMPVYVRAFLGVTLLLVLFTGSHIQLIFHMVLFVLSMLVLIPIMYNMTTISVLVSHLIYSLGYIFFCTLMSATLIYISKLHNKLDTVNVENVKLLDGMHEGLLIISKKEKSTMFCNKPAQKILNSLLGVKGKLISKDALQRAVFNGVDINQGTQTGSLSGSGSLKRTPTGCLSLEDIIVLQEDEPK